MQEERIIFMPLRPHQPLCAGGYIEPKIRLVPVARILDALAEVRIGFGRFSGVEQVTGEDFLYHDPYRSTTCKLNAITFIANRSPLTLLKYIIDRSRLIA